MNKAIVKLKERASVLVGNKYARNCIHFNYGTVKTTCGKDCIYTKCKMLDGQSDCLNYAPPLSDILKLQEVNNDR